jgi:hypothetical protein
VRHESHTARYAASFTYSLLVPNVRCQPPHLLRLHVFTI